MICNIRREGINSERLICVILGSFLIALGAQISVPCFPVPFTLQTLALLVLAIRKGSNMASLSVIAYLAEGVIGLPVFANFSGGLHTILGPTGGYLIAFVPACYLIGNLKNKGDSLFVLPLKMFAVSLLVLAIGAIHLSGFVGLENAWKFGIVPFVLSDFLKVLIAAIYSKHQQKKC